MTAAWVVRAGRNDEREAEALQEGLAIVGWPEMGDLSRFATRQDLYAGVRATYPGRSDMVVANWTGQLWRMMWVLAVGDYVVMPRRTGDAVAIGRITGDYRHRPEAHADRRNVRPVRWLRPEQPRSAIRTDLLHSIGSLLTVCQLQRNGAARRIAVLAETGTDPGPTDDELTADGLTTPDDLLATAAASETGVERTIRDLLSAWGARRRTAYTVGRIQTDLAENGLVTVPPFTDGSIGDTVRIVKSGAETDGSAEAALPANSFDTPGGGVAQAEEKPFTLRFGMLVPDNAQLVSVRPNDSLDLARTLLLKHNYSQLAIVDDDGTFHGAISWESIGKAQMAQPGVQTVTAARQNAIAAAHDDLVLLRLPEIFDRGFVFVKSQDGKHTTGIVTAADMTVRFGEIAKPFSMIEDCERRLQRRVQDLFTDDQIKKLTNGRAKGVEHMTFGNYWHVLQEPANFALLGWPLDHALFLQQLKSVGDLRNQMMHFSPDPIMTDEWGAIDGLLAMLYAVDPLP